MSGRGEIAAFLMDNHSFLIATHISPDGDTLGSALALGLALESMGKEVHLFNADGVPDAYSFLPGSERFSSSPAHGRETVVILLDCNSAERAGIGEQVFPHSAVIDHHETESDYGDIKWVEPAVPATAMMVHELIGSLGVKTTPEMATNLYAAIAIDTGTFRYSNTTAHVLSVAAALVEAGADPGYIAEKLYQNWTDNRFKLLCKYLSTLRTEGRIGISYVSREMMDSTGTTSQDTENFVNYPLLIEGISISGFLRENEDGLWKVSLRSKGDINVAEIAAGLSGGGHKNAAGGFIRGDVEEVRKALLSILKEKTSLS